MTRIKSYRPPRRDLSTLCEQILQEQLLQTDAMRARLHVPQLRDHVMEQTGFHFHFNPDLVIGIKGASSFEFIQEQFVVEAGHLAQVGHLVKTTLSAGNRQPAIQPMFASRHRRLA